MTTDTPLARYSAVNGALASGFVIAELHHLTGHGQMARTIWALLIKGGTYQAPAIMAKA